MADLTWIDGATLVTLDADQTVINKGEIWTEGDKIVAAGPQGAYKPDASANVTRIDGNQRVAMPGFINGHVHSYGALLKGSVDAEPLDVFMINAIASAGRRSPRDAYVSAMLGAIEMVSTGTTGCLDHCSHRPAHTPRRWMRSVRLCGHRDARGGCPDVLRFAFRGNTAAGR